MINHVTCFYCGDTLNKTGVCACEKMFVDERKCPECGELIFYYNDPSDDSSMSEFCINAECDYTANQFMTWEEIKASICAVEAGEECDNCLTCLGM